MASYDRRIKPMRKMTCQDLAELGWTWGLWDAQERQWDALTIELEDAISWRNDGLQVYDLATGDKWATSPTPSDDV